MGRAVRISCEQCGDTDVPVERLQLNLTMTGDDLRNVVQFECPGCGRTGRQRVGERATRLLNDLGVDVTMSAPTPSKRTD
jgi:predicted RNA-binding Zn-ribbon protein involved in translation (DUF1610 family)